MIHCPRQGCGFENLNDSLYCELCGESLQALQRSFPHIVYNPESSNPVQGAIQFMLPDATRRVSLQDTLLLLKQASETSRGDHRQRSVAEHIQWTVRQQPIALEIMDLGEIEGIKVNGHLIPPYMPYKMANGDLIIDIATADTISVNGSGLERYDMVTLKNGDKISLGAVQIICCMS